MRTFSRPVLIDAPVETVFAFHASPGALGMLTPPFPPVRIVRRTGGLEPGAIVELRVAGMRWVARHGTLIENRLFCDEQIEGPLARWVHRHEFAAEGVRTRLVDRVEYELPGGPLVNRLFGWAVDIGLRRMFDHRHRVTRRECERMARDLNRFPPV